MVKNNSPWNPNLNTQNTWNPTQPLMSALADRGCHHFGWALGRFLQTLEIRMTTHLNLRRRAESKLTRIDFDEWTLLLENSSYRLVLRTHFARRLFGVLNSFTAIWNWKGSQNTYGRSVSQVVAGIERISELVSVHRPREITTIDRESWFFGNSALSEQTSVVQFHSARLDSRTGEWTMKQLFAFLQVVCAKVYSSFVQHRLRTEFPYADNLVGRRLDHSSDDPRKSNGVPTVGILWWGRRNCLRQAILVDMIRRVPWSVAKRP
jgi:hypothetical protein